MTNTKFGELWTQISNAAQDLENTAPKDIKFDPSKKLLVQYEYDKLRIACKENHMMHYNKEDKQNILLDRHKVAACIAGAIIRTSPIDILIRNDGSLHNRYVFLANETLALFSALAIVKAYIRADKNNTIELEPSLKQQFLESGYVFPNPQHSEYLPWLLYLLQDSKKGEFNVLAFSNILYLVEAFTFSQLRLNRIQNETNKA